MISDWSISIWIWTVFCLWCFLILVHCSNPYQITFILPELKGPSKSHESYSVGMTHIIWFILSPSLTLIGNHDACFYSFIAYFSFRYLWCFWSEFKACFWTRMFVYVSVSELEWEPFQIFFFFSASSRKLQLDFTVACFTLFSRSKIN